MWSIYTSIARKDFGKVSNLKFSNALSCFLYFKEILKLINYFIYTYETLSFSKKHISMNPTPTLTQNAEKKTIDLTPDTAFDTEYIAKMQAEGYTINDSAHARMILKDEQVSDPEILEKLRNVAMNALKSDPRVHSVTIVNESRTFREVILNKPEESEEPGCIIA